MRHVLKTVLTALVSAGCPAALAQLPLNVEQLMTEQSRWQWVSAFGHSHRLREGEDSSSLRTVTAALRYGAWRDVELNARFQAAEIIRRARNLTDRQPARSVSAGINWRVKAESATPALLLELRADLLSQQGRRQQSLAAAELRFTSYTSIDPVVLSLTGGVRQQRSYRVDKLRIDPGHRWWLAPQVNFAVNRQVTLIGGVSFAKEAGTSLSNGIRSAAVLRTGLRTGLAYAPDRRHSLFLMGDYSADAGDAAINLQWNYQF